MDMPPRVVPAGEYDQVVRLAAFRVRHPEAHVRDLGRGGIWQAVIPQPDGEIVVTRVLLEDLLDALDVLGPSLGWLPRAGRACGGAGGHPPHPPPGDVCPPSRLPAGQGELTVMPLIDAARPVPLVVRKNHGYSAW